MGILLNLETATTNCSVSIARDGVLLAIRENNTPNYSHAEQLHVFIQECIAEAGLTIADIDAVAVSKGPGSYTGLRIGISAAKGLCFALDIPLIAIATLKSLASQSAKEFDYIIPVLDARRMEVYAAVYNNKLEELRETQAQIIDETSFSAYDTTKTVHFIGSGAAKIQETIAYDNCSFTLDAVPSAKEMVLLSHKKYQEKQFENVAYFEPYYLKDFMIQTKKKPSIG